MVMSTLKEEMSRVVGSTFNVRVEAIDCPGESTKPFLSQLIDNKPVVERGYQFDASKFKIKDEDPVFLI